VDGVDDVDDLGNVELLRWPHNEDDRNWRRQSILVSRRVHQWTPLFPL